MDPRTLISQEFENMTLEDDKPLEETVRYIKDASTMLKCSIIARAKALLIYHHFRRCVDRAKYDPYMVAAACISLSVKYNEEPVEFDVIILVFYRIIEQGSYRSTESPEFKDMKYALTMMECLILRMIEFSLNHVVAHEYLAYFMNDLREELSLHNIWDVFAEACTRLASDFYLGCKCLDYKAEEIAVTVVKVSLYLLGVDVNTKSYNLKIWLKALADCPEKRSRELIKNIFIICDVRSCRERKRERI